MTIHARCLNTSDAATHVGVSVKALRLYEEKGLVVPNRTPAGYRTYTPEQLGRATHIASLRALGLSLTVVARVLRGEPESLATALASQQQVLEREIRRLADARDKVREIRTDLAAGKAPDAAVLPTMQSRSPQLTAGFALPWPWGGEWFEWPDIRPLNYITGPLGCGKTRLAECLSAVLPGARFLGLTRIREAVAQVANLVTDRDLQTSVTRSLEWLIDEGATASDALAALLIALHTEHYSVLVIDTVEQELDRLTQEALMAYLRHRVRTSDQHLFLLTRSTAILDLTGVGLDEAIVYCPANHSPPIRVMAHPGASGYEAVTTCLASPQVRARTAGVFACNGGAASASS